MKKVINKAFFTSVIAVFSLAFSGALHAAPKKTSSYITYKSKKTYPKNAYTKKEPYAGYGKTSSANGLPKTKIVTGHTKKTNNGYAYVNPYARSK